MYQLTYFAGNELHAVTSPSYRAIEELYFNMPKTCLPRFWDVSDEVPFLLA